MTIQPDGDLMVAPGALWTAAHHKIAVRLNRDGESAMLLVRKRGPDGRRRVVADAFAARASDVLVVLGEIPQTQRPVHPTRYQRPVFVPDLLPQLHREARGADWARVPSIGGVGLRAFVRVAIRGRNLSTARLERALAIRRRLALDFLDERG